jgi:hypothetical protein
LLPGESRYRAGTPDGFAKATARIHGIGLHWRSWSVFLDWANECNGNSYGFALIFLRLAAIGVWGMELE